MTLEESKIWLSDNNASIIAGIISSIIVVILQVFVKSASNSLTYLFTYRLGIKQLISFVENPTVYSGGDSSNFKTTTVPDATAYFNICATLENLSSKKVNHVPITKLNTPTIPKENIVSVGGPKYNGITQKILNECLPNDISFSPDGDLNYYGKILSKTLEINTDYGLIARIKNPKNEKKRIILLAGCGPFGTLAASYYFSINERKFRIKRGLFKKLKYKIFTEKFEFSAVFKCKYLEDDIVEITLIDAKELNPITKKNKV